MDVDISFIRAFFLVGVYGLLVSGHLVKLDQGSMVDHVPLDNSLEPCHTSLIYHFLSAWLRLWMSMCRSFLVLISRAFSSLWETRNLMGGPWQVPVVDIAVTATSLSEGLVTGEAMAMGGKPNLAVIFPAAFARMEWWWLIYYDHWDSICRKDWC